MHFLRDKYYREWITEVSRGKNKVTENKVPTRSDKKEELRCPI